MARARSATALARRTMLPGVGTTSVSEARARSAWRSTAGQATSMCRFCHTKFEALDLRSNYISHMYSNKTSFCKAARPSESPNHTKMKENQKKGLSLAALSTVRSIKTEYRRPRAGTRALVTYRYTGVKFYCLRSLPARSSYTALWWLVKYRRWRRATGAVGGGWPPGPRANRGASALSPSPRSTCVSSVNRNSR